MKRNLMIITVSSFILASCSASGSSMRAKQVLLNVGDDNTIYLALSSIGVYTGSELVVQDKIEDVFLENAIEYTAKVGDPLPGADVISSTSGATFESWVSYDGTGALTEYTTVPNVEGKILYAYFGGGTQTSQSQSQGGNSSEEIVNAPWYIVGTGSFTEGGASWSVETGIPMSVNSAYTGDGNEYYATDVSFVSGDLWKLCNSDGSQWIKNGWETNQGGLKKGDMTLVDDGYKGYNVHVETTGLYDIYFKVYTNGNYNCYISEAK